MGRPSAVVYVAKPVFFFFFSAAAVVMSAGTGTFFSNFSSSFREVKTHQY